MNTLNPNDHAAIQEVMRTVQAAEIEQLRAGTHDLLDAAAQLTDCVIDPTNPDRLAVMSAIEGSLQQLVEDTPRRRMVENMTSRVGQTSLHGFMYE